MQYCRGISRAQVPKNRGLYRACKTSTAKVQEIRLPRLGQPSSPIVNSLPPFTNKKINAVSGRLTEAYHAKFFSAADGAEHPMAPAALQDPPALSLHYRSETARDAPGR